MSVTNRTVLLLIMMVAVALGAFGWHALKTREDSEREKFVSEFISSVNDNTEFFKRYVSEKDLSALVQARSRITKAYRIEIIEEVLGDYEYHIQFSNGVHAILYLDISNGKVRAVALDV